MGWRSFNDRLALFLILIIPLLWLAEGWGKVKLSPEVVGALIATWTLILQYYFRTKPPADTPPSSRGTPPAIPNP